jgi:hypothetical protein
MLVFNVKKKLEAAFWDVAGERYPPNAARTKHVSQTLDPTPFGDAAEDALISQRGLSMSIQFQVIF